ncbi:MAG: DNA-3-methyladenine glycosylase [Verrucomicrobiaceae bacterium]|nr:MAG: DNA-3-methyladenine glycosylase [Verrucomicrobiaceae bacterium]
MPDLNLNRDFFDRPFLDVARGLIGATLCWQGCGGRIVEVEAYAVEGDAACHTATRRSSRLFYQENPPGTAYVYLNYGIHWMLNVLAREGILLIRALEPQFGIPVMQARRRQENPRALCSGPGKLGQALGFTGQDHGKDLTGGVFRSGGAAEIVADRRIGITKAAELPWRFMEAGSPWVSVPPGPFAVRAGNAGSAVI